MTALSRDPDRRWQQATALRTALTTLTRRLGLICTNQQMVEWIALAVRSRQAAGPQAPRHGVRARDGALRPEPLDRAGQRLDQRGRRGGAAHAAPDGGRPEHAGAVASPAEPSITTIERPRPLGDEYRAAADSVWPLRGAGRRRARHRGRRHHHCSGRRRRASRRSSCLPRTIGPARTRGLTELRPGRASRPCPT